MATSTAEKPQLDHLYDVSELVAYGYGTGDTIRELIHAGKVPAVRIGGKYKIRHSDLDKLAVPVVAKGGDAA